MNYKEFDKDGFAYPIIRLSKKQIEKLTCFHIKTNDDISYCVKILIENC